MKKQYKLSSRELCFVVAQVEVYIDMHCKIRETEYVRNSCESSEYIEMLSEQIYNAEMIVSKLRGQLDER